MEAQYPTADTSYAVPPPPFSPSASHRSSTDVVKSHNMMDLDSTRSDHERSTRAASVLSGMSIEDMEAAETLNSLQQSRSNPRVAPSAHSSTFSTPPQKHPIQNGPPVHVHTTTTFDVSQPEPLLRLFTSQYPLAGSLLNGSLTAYKTTQSFIPGAEWTERNVGLPMASTVARVTGVEGGLRWVLQTKRDPNSKNSRTPDVEQGIDTLSQSETLPAYSDGDRSPPYTEEEVVLLQQSSQQQQHPPPGWRQQLLVSTSGLGVAMSEESLRRLRFCLSWLRWANGRLGEAIQNLKVLLERYGDAVTAGPATQMSVANLTGNGQQDQQRQAMMAARIADLRRDVLETLKKVVGIVSQYAGGALPQNARELVHRHLTSLPQRFNVANAMVHRSSNGSEDKTSETEVSANRVMVLAQEGLDMMTQVSRVVNDTLVSAEGWCERLGKNKGSNTQDHQSLENEKQPSQAQSERSMTEVGDQDVKMEM
jgi:transcriptional repressor OPI1